MTREEAIDILKNTIVRFGRSNGKTAYAEALQMAIKALEEPQWIPVAERLPEDGLYLVTTSKGQTQVQVFSHNGNSEEYWMRCNKAWMPEPEPWRGDEE